MKNIPLVKSLVLCKKETVEQNRRVVKKTYASPITQREKKKICSRGGLGLDEQVFVQQHPRPHKGEVVEKGNVRRAADKVVEAPLGRDKGDTEAQQLGVGRDGRQQRRRHFAENWT